MCSLLYLIQALFILESILIFSICEMLLCTEDFLYTVRKMRTLLEAELVLFQDFDNNR